MTTEGLTLAELKAQVMTVAEARVQAAGLKRQRDLLLEAWNKNNQELLDDLTQAGANVAVEETKLRELTIKAYNETGSKSPVDGVGIREITKLEYDTKVALDWATHHEIALKLDVSAFEKIAKANKMSFVTVTTELQATISTKLGTG